MFIRSIIYCPNSLFLRIILKRKKINYNFEYLRRSEDITKVHNLTKDILMFNKRFVGIIVFNKNTTIYNINNLIDKVSNYNYNDLVLTLDNNLFYGVYKNIIYERYVKRLLGMKENNYNIVGYENLKECTILLCNILENTPYINGYKMEYIDIKIISYFIIFNKLNILSFKKNIIINNWMERVNKILLGEQIDINNI